MFLFATPTQQENRRSLNDLINEKEQKTIYLNELKIRYEKSISEYEFAFLQQQMSHNTRTSLRNQKRKNSCKSRMNGCRSKYCNNCVVVRAQKQMRAIGMNLESTEVELRVIESEIENARYTQRPVRRQLFPSATEENPSSTINHIPGNNNNDGVIEQNEVMDEPEIKIEIDDGPFIPTIGIINSVKSEPMEITQNRNSATDESSNSESETSSEDSNENDADQTDTDQSEASSYSDYPSTPQHDYSSSSDDHSTESEDNDEFQDRAPQMRSILQQL